MSGKGLLSLRHVQISLLEREKPIKSERLEVRCLCNLFTSCYAKNLAFPRNVCPLPFYLQSSPCPPIPRIRSVVISDKRKKPLDLTLRVHLTQRLRKYTTSLITSPALFTTKRNQFDSDRRVRLKHTPQLPSQSHYPQPSCPSCPSPSSPPPNYSRQRKSANHYPAASSLSHSSWSSRSTSS